jgi:hypothetical protein
MASRISVATILLCGFFAGTLLCFFPSKLEFRPNRVPVPARGIIAIGQFACGVITISQFGIGFTQELDA